MWLQAGLALARSFPELPPSLTYFYRRRWRVRPAVSSKVDWGSTYMPDSEEDKRCREQQSEHVTKGRECERHFFSSGSGSWAPGSVGGWCRQLRARSEICQRVFFFSSRCTPAGIFYCCITAIFWIYLCPSVSLCGGGRCLWMVAGSAKCKQRESLFVLVWVDIKKKNLKKHLIFFLLINIPSPKLPLSTFKYNGKNESHLYE